MVTAAALVELIGPWADGADPLNEQLADALARAIEIGMLPAGTKLPAERELARELALSRTTIVAAYDRLRLAGLARSRQGSGTDVATRRRGCSPSPRRPEDTDTEAPFRIARSSAGAGFPDWLVQHDADAIQFTIGALPAGPAVADCVETALRDDVPALLNEMGYDPFGWPRLRAGIAAYLARGVPTDSDQILVTNGAQQAVHLIGSQIGGPGTAVVLENPTYIGAIDAFRTTGNRLLPMPVDPDGPRVDMAGLLAASAPVRLAYVVPTFHNPTGATMPEARRRELARAAGEFGFQVVEDLTRLNPRRRCAAADAAFDPGDRVITIGSLSKLAWGGLRIGWMAPHAPTSTGSSRARSSPMRDQPIIGHRGPGPRPHRRGRGRNSRRRRRAPRDRATWPSGSQWTWTMPKAACRCGCGSPMPTPCSSAGSPPGMASSSARTPGVTGRRLP